MGNQENQKSPSGDFAEAGSQKRSSFITEYFYLLRTNRKWWMLPLIIVFLLFGALMMVVSTGAAPFIYTLF